MTAQHLLIGGKTDGHYFEHFLKNIKQQSGSVADENVKNIKIIFGNIDTLLPLNKELLERLGERGDAWDMNQVYIQSFPSLSVLKLFCLNSFSVYSSCHTLCIHLFI